MSSPHAPMHALLVGINDYASERVPDLRGCVNDVEAMQQLLTSRFGLAAENVLKLTDAQATHEAIKAAIRTQLIEPARKWADAGKHEPSPSFFFHYSGHGSQAIDETGQEPDGLDETLVPHDSRTEDIYDIKDWELGALIDELTKYTDSVTLVLDCCHSGSGTRDVKITRRAEPDMRPQPTQRPASNNTRSLESTPSGWALGQRYVLLAGCRDREESYEYTAQQDNSARHHGALTYFLIEELQSMSTARRYTYSELHQRVRQRVNSKFPQQMPQCEGDRGREVFGGLRPVQEPFINVTGVRDGAIEVEGGLAHGLTEGSQLHVYPLETRTLADAGEPIATLRVDEVGAVRSRCTVEEGPSDFEMPAKAVVYRLNHGQMQRSVALDIADADVAQQVETLLQADDVQPYVRMVENENAEFHLVQQSGQPVQIQNAAGTQLVAAFPSEKLTELPRDLTHLVRYHNTLDLKSAPDAELSGTVTVEIKELAFEAGSTEPTATSIDSAAGGDMVVEAGTKLVIEITNQSDQALYLGALFFDTDWSISLLYPRMSGAHEPLAAGKTFSLGLSNKRKDQLLATLDADVAEAQQFVKVIASTDDADYEILQQGALKAAYTTRSAKSVGQRGSASPLSQLFEQAMTGGTKRALGAPVASADDQWTTAQAGYVLTQPADSKAVAGTLRGGETTRVAAYDLSIEAPAGFHGAVRILTQTQGTRTANSLASDLRPPPGLAGAEAQIQPFNLAPTRAVGPSAAVIEIDADDQSRQQLSEETPLTLHLPSDAVGEDAVIALAFDGNFYYPVGRPAAADARSTLEIGWLPEVDAADAPEESRNIGRTVKLYLYKLVGKTAESVGLHRARFVPSIATDVLSNVAPSDSKFSVKLANGQMHYWDVDELALEPGQRVALVVHGFSSETRFAAAALNQLFAANGVNYDHLLTYDYESYNTSIADNGKQMSERLAQLGFGAEDGVQLDIFAHSMGTLVARSLVELWGGDDFVDRCFLFGPPNQGTRLAQLKKLAPWSAALLLNWAKALPFAAVAAAGAMATAPLIASLTPALLAGWAFKKVVDDGVGVDNLQPNSAFLQQLNGLTEPATTPYYIVAGELALPDGPRRMLELLWTKVMTNVPLVDEATQLSGIDPQALLNGSSDLVISVDSMTTVRHGHYPDALLATQRVPCNHFQYFSAQESVEQLLAWLQA